jgi:Ca-activated chloride channel homolog
MSFGHPLMLLTLLALPLLALAYLYVERRRARYAVTFTNIDVLASVAPERSWRRFVPPALFLLALAFLCVALARPHRSTLVASDKATVILVIDVSGSMHATDVKPSRLGAAQAAVREFLKRVPKHVKVGLIAFSSEPQVGAPPSTDRTLVEQSLNSLGFLQAYGGTAIGDALAAAVQLGQRSIGENPKRQTIALITQKNPLVSILFLSDGKQTRGTLTPFMGAQKAKAAGIPVYTVALGTPNGVLTRPFGFGGGGGIPSSIPVPPDPATLRAIANVTGGKFFNATSAGVLQSAYKQLGSKLGRVHGNREATNEAVFLAALALIAAAVLSALWAPRLP